jgi:hypothetical protein
MAPPTNDPRDTSATDLPGSGDLGLESEITKMRGAILRAVNELDLFSRSVREARIRVEQLQTSLEEEHREQ